MMQGQRRELDAPSGNYLVAAEEGLGDRRLRDLRCQVRGENEVVRIGRHVSEPSDHAALMFRAIALPSSEPVRS
jgi:hypothetical protein